MLVLGVETSCDETSLAFYHTETGLIDQVIYSQIEQHQCYGGVVPEIAARTHSDRIVPLYHELLNRTQVRAVEIDGVAYTAGPGLVGALMVGACFAHSFAETCGLPKVAVNHLEGHIFSAWLPKMQVQWPCLVLLVSGGHTALILAQGIGKYVLLGQTLDDAAGEAFDKTAKLMGLPYPGGVYLDQLALKGDAERFKLPRPLIHQAGYDFSFSGLKTAAIRVWETCHQTDLDRADLAATFQNAVVDCLLTKTVSALKAHSVKRFAVVGGVSANSHLRQRLRSVLPSLGVDLLMPDVCYCTDNAAMIAAAGAARLVLGSQTPEAIQVVARWPIDQCFEIDEF